MAEANTAKEALDLARDRGLPFAELIAERARQTALGVLDGETAVSCLVFDRAGQLVGRADG